MSQKYSMLPQPDLTVQSTKLNWIKDVGIVFGIILVVLLFSSHDIRIKYMVHKINQNPQITVGKITGTVHSYRTPPTSNYSFFIGIKSYIGVYTEGGYIDADKLVDKYFPVIYLEDDPEGYHDMLIFPEDFDRYNLLFPDSLRWVKAL